MQFEIFQDVAGKWRWNARYDNGKSAGNGAEPFASESNVRRAIKAFVSAIGAAPAEVWHVERNEPIEPLPSE